MVANRALTIFGFFPNPNPNLSPIPNPIPNPNDDERKENIMPFAEKKG